MSIKDLPDYEKRIIIITPPGVYPAIMQVDLRQILGVDLLTPTLAGRVPISIERPAILDELIKADELILLDKINPVVGGEHIINGGFEINDTFVTTAGWIPEIELYNGSTPHTGSYCGYFYEYSSQQIVDLNVNVTDITTFSCYTKGYYGTGGAAGFVKILYTDDTTTDETIFDTVGWVLHNLKAVADPTKIVANISIEGGTQNPFYIDDVSLITKGYNTVIDLVREIAKIDSMPALTGTFTVEGSEGVALQQKPTTNELLIWINNFTDLIDLCDTYGPLKTYVLGDQNVIFPQDPTTFEMLTSPTDKWARELGQVDLARVLGSALAHSNPVITRLTSGTAFIDPRDRNWTITESLARSWNLGSSDIPDLLDKAARLLGIVYGDKGQLAQRTTSKDLYVQLRSAGSEIDPTAIRALTSGDIVTVVQSTPANLTATVTQAAKDRTISSVDATATPLQINLAALNGNSAALYTPAGGKAIRIKFISIEHSADVDIGYRFGAAGDIYYLRTTKGYYVSNLIGCNNQGAADAAFYLNSSAATNVKGYVLLTEV